MSDELGKGGDQGGSGLPPGAQTGSPKQVLHRKSGGWVSFTGKPNDSSDTPLGAKNAGTTGVPKEN